MGMGVIALIRRIRKSPRAEKPFSSSDLPFVVAMIVLDIAAPILLLLGLSMTTAANASLLNNFEDVATSLIAFFVFKEALSRQLAIAIEERSIRIDTALEQLMANEETARHRTQIHYERYFTR